MPAPAPTAAPPNFYDNMPPGGDAGAGGPAPKKPGGESDVSEEIMKGFTGIMRVLGKMAKLNKEIKPGIDKIKEDIKVLVVQGLKKDPKDLDSGEDKAEPEAATPPPPPGPGGPAAPPSSTDETHSA